MALKEVNSLSLAMNLPKSDRLTLAATIITFEGRKTEYFLRDRNHCFRWENWFFLSWEFFGDWGRKPIVFKWKKIIMFIVWVGKSWKYAGWIYIFCLLSRLLIGGETCSHNDALSNTSKNHIYSFFVMEVKFAVCPRFQWVSSPKGRGFSQTHDFSGEKKWR